MPDLIKSLSTEGLPGSNHASVLVTTYYLIIPWVFPPYFVRPVSATGTDGYFF
ncbi:hypothetical protein ASPZODRAFT_131896 [Penicilliopsis zonata CBS 506.65]|uniref:Uncharacterized protein n=1 Tax=Penicilliopsis zonata CBS 506.65 TaxID=1073090 RepID=A0A1L9SIC4_9EURO|nr:hypothetical protein ASPZODRAFT_131896 [Penicilliopsis zonata CBS 506.65]OJJ46980.1 hypothetical protein ASPZODRAFT_131896 [Penicilliopsis zonata CBS 506.65]